MRDASHAGVARHPAVRHPLPGVLPDANAEPDDAGPDVSPASRNSSTPDTWTSILLWRSNSDGADGSVGVTLRTTALGWETPVISTTHVEKVIGQE